MKDENTRPTDHGAYGKLQWIGNRLIRLKDLYHHELPTHWFRTTRNSGEEWRFFSTNDEKNADQPVVRIEEFTNEADAKDSAKWLRSPRSPLALHYNLQVRVHKRTVRFDTISLNRWYVVARQLPNREGA